MTVRGRMLFEFQRAKVELEADLQVIQGQQLRRQPFLCGSWVFTCGSLV